MGIPVMSAIAAAEMAGVTSPEAVLHGVSTALTVNATICVIAASLIAAFLRVPARKPVTA